MLKNKTVNLGLKPHQLALVLDVLDEVHGLQRAVIFGSRALGTYQDNSDIDIAIEGEGLTIDAVAFITDRLEYSSLPFNVDVVVKHKIKSKELLEHIEAAGIVVLER
ncbi:hypothetical protein BCV02_14785 [Vibrio breoganii]|uniref:Nucleotidyltransferase domain-containing protein n=1 Tax=Vibrio breoganii TaxID=553239 RepID=A0ABX1UE90_9VIBR|nr:nucleotidyltransferase domain-containing protein [Vibrio breoganii]NMO74801.1 nucleotidyltransferase domain-containing protein [Vibrio breoganii]NMR71476.1 nucleotidyltransferase domain-containing protein [Vibrio breoganii]PMG00660.1 hypothetical protein BCV02_14785 [Vibrio breoganii]PML54008.1 hypothetical protein BCT73_17075 [Vibrio breoganii]PML84921.1 hypothetical protein BCT67_15720 [Vibrio breoganii]